MQDLLFVVVLVCKICVYLVPSLQQPVSEGKTSSVLLCILFEGVFSVTSWTQSPVAVRFHAYRYIQRFFWEGGGGVFSSLEHVPLN